MKKGKWIFALFSALLLLAICLMAGKTSFAPSVAYPAEIQISGEQTVHLWTRDGEIWYGFLPGHGDPADTWLVPAQDSEVTLDGRSLPLRCADLMPGQAYTLSWQQDGVTREQTLILMQSGNVATLYLNTQSGTMDYIHEEKGNAERGSLRLYDETGNLNYSGSVASLAGRGNSTWVVSEKKPYSLELTEEADLLGMGAAKKWILLADALDASGLRNKIVYDAAAQMDFAYTPETRWTELYLNGTYSGLYLLCERVEVDPQRLDLGPDASLVCMDRDIRVEEKTDPYFVTDHDQYLRIIDGHDIGALKAQFQAMEDALLSGSGDEWMAYIDLDSWVKKYLVEEIFGNYDAGFQSQYFYCTELGGKIYAGPVWDYDSSLGNPQAWSLNSPQGLYAWRPAAMVDYDTPWLNALYEKEAFRAELQRQYRTFLPLLEGLPSRIEEDYVNQIGAAYQRNRIRWNVDTDGLSAEAARIGDYLRQRLDFLTGLWLEEKEFQILRLQEGETAGYYGYYAVEPGTVFDAWPEQTGEDFLGWYREDTGEAVDPAEPIWEDLQLYPHYEGFVSPEPEDETSLKDLVLRLYHYVPLGVLVLMGVVMVPVSIYKTCSPKSSQKQPVK